MNPTDTPPKVSIGLPVYNGENYVEQALDAILAQTHRDFELIICDNASTDRTGDICREYAARDKRIRYYRNPKNIGAGPNFNLVFSYARGEYFKWIAHDDLHEPEFLARCFEVLESDPDVVLAYTRAVTIDGEGNRLMEWGYKEGLSAESPHLRLRAGLEPYVFPVPLPIFGLIRADVLRRTHLQGDYPACDLVLVAEIALNGKFQEIEEPLYVQRNFDLRAGIVINDDLDQAAAFWDPDHNHKLSMFYWVILRGFVGAVRTQPLGWRDRIRCYAEIPAWMRHNRRELQRDLGSLCKRIPVLGPAGERIYLKHRKRRWRSETRKTGADLRRHLPGDARFVLLDHASFDSEEFARRSVPLIRRDGKYYGHPKDNEQAIRALAELEDRGIRFVVIARPCYWWFEHYSGFIDHLASRYEEVFRNDRVTIYEGPDPRLGRRREEPVGAGDRDPAPSRA